MSTNLMILMVLTAAAMAGGARALLRPLRLPCPRPAGKAPAFARRRAQTLRIAGRDADEACGNDPRRKLA